MLAALCDNYEFFKPKLNLVILLAPVARVDRMTSKALQNAKDSNLANKMLNMIGKELFANPSADGTVSSGLMKASGMNHFGL